MDLRFNSAISIHVGFTVGALKLTILPFVLLQPPQRATITTAGVAYSFPIFHVLEIPFSVVVPSVRIES